MNNNLLKRIVAALSDKPQTIRRTSWMNIYQQGYYHRCGKPGTLNAHPGDLYDTREEALADIDPDAPYVTTVGFDWDAPFNVLAYPVGSTPVPLRETRKQFEQPEAVGTLELIRRKYAA